MPEDFNDNSQTNTNQESDDTQISKEDYYKLKEEVLAQRENIRKKQAEVDRLTAATNKSVNTQNKNVPNARDFDSDEDYLRALNKYNFESLDIDSLLDKKIKEKEFKKLNNERVARFKKQQSELLKQYPDYTDVVFDDAVESIYRATPGLSETVMSMDNNAKVAHHLAQNPEKLAQISSLPPAYMAAEIAKIDSSISAKNSHTTTSAPKPINPIESGKSPKEFNPDDLDEDAWNKWRAAQG